MFVSHARRSGHVQKTRPQCFNCHGDSKLCKKSDINSHTVVKLTQMILIGHTGNTVHMAQHTMADIYVSTLELFNIIIVQYVLRFVF